MKKTFMLLLIAGVGILSIWLIRPPAWATPLPLLDEQATLQAEPVQVAEMTTADVAEVEPGHQAGNTAPEFQADTPSSDNCIACHTDKKKLKKLAEEPEKVKSEEASGEG